MLLAIETSCDETAVAVFDLSAFSAGRPVEECLRADLISSQAKLHRPYGGVVPELAAREHIRNLPCVISEALHEAGISDAAVSAVSVTQGPGLKGSLLVGMSFAKAYALSLGRPLIPLHHLEGHLFAGELLPPGSRPENPTLALLVSGGHTMLILIHGLRRYEVIARTRDDAAGEAFDKIASLLRLPYPGGPALSRAAESGNPTRFQFPVGVPADRSSFSFSGLKTAVLRTVQTLREPLPPDVIADLAASSERAIVRSLVEKSIQAAEHHRPRSFLLTGGVAANRVLRRELEREMGVRGIKFSVPPPRWCTDNAAMMAALTARLVDTAGKIDNVARAPVSLDFGARPRWPIEELK